MYKGAIYMFQYFHALQNVMLKILKNEYKGK